MDNRDNRKKLADELSICQASLDQLLQALDVTNHRLAEAQTKLAQANFQQKLHLETIETLQQSEHHYRHLFEQTQATLIKTEALYEISRHLTMFEALPKLLQAVVDGVVNALSADGVVLIMADRQNEQVVHFVKAGPQAQKINPLAYDTLQSGLVEPLVQNQKPLLLTNMEHREAVEKFYFNQKELDIGSMMLVPLRSQHQPHLQGLMVALNSPNQRDFSPQDLKLLAAMADQAVIGIDSAMLAEASQTYAHELEEKNQSLARLNKIKDEFLSNTSHGLRTPLNGMIGIAESMLDGVTGNLSSTQGYNLSMIVSSGRRLMNLINDILDSARFGSEAVNLQLQPVDLFSVTDTILTFSQPMVKDKMLYLRNEISPNLPSVKADEGRLQQILYNLVENGIKATEEGNVTISARVCSWRNPNGQTTAGEDISMSDSQTLIPDALEISVIDTGQGMSAKKLAETRQALEQAEALPMHRFDGLGLGLSITKRLIELHGGKLELHSTPNKGSRATFTLPASRKRNALLKKAPQEIARVREAMAKAILTNNRPDGGKYTVLMVDDEPIMRLMVKNHLELYDFEVVEAKDGFEALEILAQITPDVILLDIMMPKISGYDVCFKVRQVKPAHELPIILLTARSQLADILAGFEVGANDYITKPINQEELVARIKTHLNLAKINTAYGRFVPQEFLHLLGRDSIVDVKLGDQVQQRMTVLFADIRSFTSLSERMTPKENFEFLNQLLSEIGPLIREHQGFIDKYIGDAIMALFPRGADDAVQAALAMLAKLEQFNLSHEFETPIKMGIGLHTGSLILGTVGEVERMETTVISDAVNTAARLEGLTKQYQVDLLISKATLNDLTDAAAYQHRFLDKVRVKGRQKPVEIYEFFGGDDPELQRLKVETKPLFEQGAREYHDQNPASMVEAMQQVLQSFPQDKMAQLYLARVDVAGGGPDPATDDDPEQLTSVEQLVS